MVGAAASAGYARPASTAEALAQARAAVPGLEPRFVLYTAGMDDRKNFQGLFRAWARLPAAVRDAWQLVMVCSMDDPTRNHLVHLARGVGHRRPAAAARVRARRGVAPAVPVDRPLRVPVALRGLRAADRRSARVRRAHDRLEHVGGRGAARAGGAVRPGGRRRDRDARSSARSPTHATRAALDAQAQPPASRAGTTWPIASPAVYERLLARRVATARAPAAAGRGGHAAPARGEWRRRLQLPVDRPRCRRTATCTRSPTACAASIPRSARRARRTVSRCCRCGTSWTTNGRAAATTASCTASATASIHARRARAAAAAVGHRARARGAAHRPLRVQRATSRARCPTASRRASARCTTGCPPAPVRRGGSPPTRPNGSACSWPRRSWSSPTASCVMSEFAADRVRLDVDARRRGPHRASCPSGCRDPVARRDRRPRRARRSIASFGVVNEIKQYSLLLAALPGVVARVSRRVSSRSSGRAPTPTARRSSTLAAGARRR